MNPLASTYFSDKHSSYRVKVAAGWNFRMAERAVQDADESEVSE